MLKNSGGNTLEYADKKQVIVGDAKPYDSMTDDEIMNAVNERPSVDWIYMQKTWKNTHCNKMVQLWIENKIYMWENAGSSHVHKYKNA